MYEIPSEKNNEKNTNNEINKINDIYRIYKSEINVLIFFIIIYITLIYLFNYYYPEVNIQINNDTFFFNKILNGFRNVLYKYMIFWLIILYFGIILLNDTNKRNINFMTKNIVIMGILLLLLIFPFYPYVIYYDYYISLIRDNMKYINMIFKKSCYTK